MIDDAAEVILLFAEGASIAAVAFRRPRFCSRPATLGHESQACNRDTAMFSMLNAEWRDRAKDALEKFLASDSGATSKRARAQAASKAAAADVAGVPEGGSQKKNA